MFCTGMLEFDYIFGLLNGASCLRTAWEVVGLQRFGFLSVKTFESKVSGFGPWAGSHYEQTSRSECSPSVPLSASPIKTYLNWKKIHTP